MRCSTSSNLEESIGPMSFTGYRMTPTFLASSWHCKALLLFCFVCERSAACFRWQSSLLATARVRTLCSFSDSDTLKRTVFYWQLTLPVRSDCFHSASHELKQEALEDRGVWQRIVRSSAPLARQPRRGFTCVTWLACVANHWRYKPDI